VQIQISNRTLQGFSEKAEEIRNKKTSAPTCLSFTDDFRGQFPALVYTETDANRDGACQQLHQIEGRLKRFEGRFFVASGASRAFSVHLSPDRVIPYEGKFELGSLLEFAADWALDPFGNWTLADGLKSQRRVAFFIHDTPEAAIRFLEVSQKFSDRVIVGGCLVDAFRSLYPSVSVREDSLIVFDAQKKKFQIFERISTTETFSEILNGLVKGKFDRKMKLDVVLFDRYRRANRPKSKRRSLLRPFVIIPVVAAPLLLGILFFALRSRLAKVE
jgi:hypothetical protein